MGSHYVPRHYLRQFGTPDQPGMIWAYDTAGGPAKLLPIAAVAQAKGFYDPDDEAALNDQVEAPALASLTKLRRRELLDSDERARLAVYIATLMLRVPRRRRKALELVPGILKDTTDRFRARLMEWAADPSTDQALVAQRLAEVDAVESKLATDLPIEVHQQIRSPWPKQRYVEVIHGMTWRLLIAFLEKETNRRVISVSERFVFCHRPTSWIPIMAAKANPYLSHIKW